MAGITYGEWDWKKGQKGQMPPTPPMPGPLRPVIGQDPPPGGWGPGGGTNAPSYPLRPVIGQDPPSGGWGPGGGTNASSGSTSGITYGEWDPMRPPKQEAPPPILASTEPGMPPPVITPPPPPPVWSATGTEGGGQGGVAGEPAPGKPFTPAPDVNPLRPGENPMLRGGGGWNVGGDPDPHKYSRPSGNGITYGEWDWKKGTPATGGWSEPGGGTGGGGEPQIPSPSTGGGGWTPPPVAPSPVTPAPLPPVWSATGTEGGNDNGGSWGAPSPLPQGGGIQSPPIIQQPKPYYNPLPSEPAAPAGNQYNADTRPGQQNYNAMLNAPLPPMPGTITDPHQQEAYRLRQQAWDKTRGMGLNPFDVGFQNQPATARTSFMQGLQSGKGLPQADTEQFFNRYRMRGVSR